MNIGSACLIFQNAFAFPQGIVLLKQYPVETQKYSGILGRLTLYSYIPYFFWFLLILYRLRPNLGRCENRWKCVQVLLWWTNLLQAAWMQIKCWLPRGLCCPDKWKHEEKLSIQRCDIFLVLWSNSNAYMISHFS